MKRYDFQSILELLPLVVYVDALDDKSTPQYVSPQIEQLLGWTAEEWVADPDIFIRSLHPDDRDRVLAEIQQRNAQGASTTRGDDYRLIARDGSVIWVRDDEVVVPGEDGLPASVHGYLQDVTDRRRDRIRLELLVGILGLAAEERSPEEIVAAAARLLATALGDVKVTFVEVAPDGELHARYSTETDGPVLDTFAVPGYLERLARGPIVIEDAEATDWLADHADELAAQRIGSAVDVPLRRGGRIANVLWFNTPQPRRWDADEVTVLTEVAEQLAIVLDGAEAREQRARAERDLRNRDAILQAVSGSAERFLLHTGLDDALGDLVRVLGEATTANRAYVFENVRSETAPETLRRAMWSAPGYEATIDDPRFAHLRPAPHFPRWAEALGRGEAVVGVTADLPEDERTALELISTLAIVAVPVFVDGEWWGFIGLEDCERARSWSAAETEALRAAGGLVAAAVSRERAQRDLVRRDAILQAVSRAAERLVAEPGWHNSAAELLESIGQAAATSRAYLFECSFRADGTRVASQRFEWIAEGITPELDNPALQDMSFDEVGLDRVGELVGRNELFTANVRDLAQEERELFNAQQIKSIAVVPIFVEGAWWGFIGLDDCVGERTWSEAELDALRTAASLIAAAIGRERAEAVLREHEEKLRAVFETALDAIYITDHDRRYVDVNPAGCDFLGISKRDLIGRRIDDFLPPHKLATVEEDWTRYVANGPTNQEWELQRADGAVRVAEASARPNFLPGLDIAFLRDVTDRKRLEADLLNAQKLDSLGRLAGGVAHDFNNLLTGITGYASLLLERANGDGELRRDLGEIKRAADRASELTRQLLAFGRRQVLQPRPVNLNAVLAGVGPLLERLLGQDVEVDLRPAPRLGTVRADPGQIEQVIVNLAVNARDAMPQGGRLTIETRNAGAYVEFAFTDTGVGMDEATVARIFEPFFTTREEGIGLGLASVHGIVHQSGGSIAVESTPDAGSTFVVRLPRVEEPAEEQPAEPPPQARLGSETILLVEDEDVVRDLARRVLERQGYTVLACSAGEEAVALAETHTQPIDLLLTDVVMPGLRGNEVARLVSASRPEIKILYMSGYAEETLVGRDSISGSSLIEKPFAVDALARRVRDALEAA